jgi:hypothetical protein
MTVSYLPMLTRRDENEGLRATVARQRDTIERLQAAAAAGVVG